MEILKKISYKVQAGDIIELNIPEPKETGIKAQEYTIRHCV